MEEHDYPAAESYLRILYHEDRVADIIARFRNAGIVQFKAKDIFRASQLSLLGVSNLHVEKDRKKIQKGVSLSPLLLLRDEANGKSVDLGKRGTVGACQGFSSAQAAADCAIAQCDSSVSTCATVESTKPDGSKTTTEEKLQVKSDPAYPDTIITEKTITTTETTVNNTSTITVEKASPSAAKVDPTTDNPDNSKNDPCAKDPTIIGCSHWGTPEPPEEIKTHEMDISIDPGASSSGSCPGDQIVSTRFGPIPISYKPVCLAAGYINPILISFAWLSAGFILFGTVKE